MEHVKDEQSFIFVGYNNLFGCMFTLQSYGYDQCTQSTIDYAVETLDEVLPQPAECCSLDHNHTSSIPAHRVKTNQRGDFKSRANEYGVRYNSLPVTEDGARSLYKESISRRISANSGINPPKSREQNLQRVTNRRVNQRQEVLREGDPQQETRRETTRSPNRFPDSV